MDACDDERIGTHLCGVQHSFKTIITYNPLNPHLTAITRYPRHKNHCCVPPKHNLRLGLSYAIATSSASLASPTFYLSVHSVARFHFQFGRDKPATLSTYPV